MSAYTKLMNNTTLGSDEDEKLNQKKQELHCRCGALMGRKISGFRHYVIACFDSTVE